MIGVSKTLVLATALVVSASAQAFYKCSTGNGISFQDRPCDDAVHETFVAPPAHGAISFAGAKNTEAPSIAGGSKNLLQVKQTLEIKGLSGNKHPHH